ncbi:hypothetical protein NPIL_186421 [Nephila pilipes]|uniref:Uncharacterized protein n=1 Tax=Nephila pilipes TaxID=299642 RepID=A0A8X6MNH5_NEPPI|nr:hypothetical protein NPIL_186421 [Nephila pilipes]
MSMNSSKHKRPACQPTPSSSESFEVPSEQRWGPTSSKICIVSTTNVGQLKEPSPFPLSILLIGTYAWFGSICYEDLLPKDLDLSEVLPLPSLFF